MELNRMLLFFIFEIIALPKIYSDLYPSLIVKKSNMNYTVADEIQYVEDQNNILQFSTSPEYQLFKACPDENAFNFQLYVLIVNKSVTVDFTEKPLQQFFEGDYTNYNCRYPIKPIVLRSIARPENKVAHVYDIGFLFYEWKADFSDVWKKYPTLHHVPYPRDYDFIPFLTVTMDRPSGTIISVRHRIISRGLLQPDSALNPFQPNEKNIPFYGFDVDSLYEEENQRKMFSSIFGKYSSHYYDYQEDQCLIKVQLAPYEDFLLNNWKLPSFMDLNTAAMWKKLYKQWRKIEVFVRKVARDLEPLIVETGTAEILTLAKGNDQPQSVYLRENEKSPVSKHIWKQITFKQSDDDANIQAILIVMHNDPYTENQKPICEDVGEDLGWTVSNNDYKTGLTYVCPVNENITSKLHIESKGNYASLNLNNVRKLGSDKNDTHPPLFIFKYPNWYYTVADKLHYVKGQNNIVKFSTSPEYQLYYACPEKNSPVYRKFTLKLQELVTDVEARPLEQFVKGEFNNYNCSNQIKAVVLKSKRPEFKSSFLWKIRIGFLFHEKNGNFNKLSEKYENFPDSDEYFFVGLLYIWWDKKSEATVEVCHQIVTRGLLEPDPDFSGPFQPNEKNAYFYGFDVDSLYTKENQQKVFSTVYGQSYTNYYNPPNQILRKVQLAPHEDFLLHTWKLPTFMELNTTAMWEQLYYQWRRIEIFVRQVALELGSLYIQTGASRILALPNMENNLRSLYLLKYGKFPVCRYIWKMIIFKQSDDDKNAQAVLIVMHNDPYTEDQELLCDDLGEKLGWTVSNNDYKTGLTYVCPVHQNIINRLHSKYNQSFETLNLNNIQKLKYNKDAIFPSLFITKKHDTFYTVADEFEYIEGQDNVLKFNISPGNELYNACPEENAPLYPTYALKVQELVTDFEASPLQQFVKGDFVKYNCRNPIKPIVLKTTQIFEDTFLSEYDIGFLIREENGNFDKLSELYQNFPDEIQEYNFLYFLTTTIDQKSGTILSVVHRIISGELLEPEPANSSPFQFNEKNIYAYGFDVNSLYTEENQRKMFSSIFGQSYTDYYNPPNQSLRKFQLAPYDDFLLYIWKLPSFMDLNTATMWVQLNPQWRRIELFVRGVARKLKKLTIETGTARVLSLNDANDLQQPVYLREEQKSPVSLYIWKMVKFEQLDDDYYTQAVLIVMHNDPYTQNQKPICDDVSEDWGWMVSNKDYKTGLTYGCPVNESITTQLHDKFNVNYASLNLNAVQILEYDKDATFPSLFITKTPNNIYTIADKFQYVEGQDDVLKFYTLPGYQLYNACPDENARFHRTYTLKVQQLVTDLEASPLQQFVHGDFVKYNCQYPIKPIVLKCKQKFNDPYADQYDIGFLIQEKNGNFDKLSEVYENFTEIREYDFLRSLTVTMDWQSGTTLSVLHRIISRGLLEAESDYSVPLQHNEKNFDIYGFDVDTLYTEENQEKMFYSIFGQLYTDYYNPPHKSLRKVQLAPHNDFLFNTWKLSSFMDLNTTAMWDQLYAQWRRIEVYVRGVAREFEALTIETGATRILTLNDANDLQQRVYLWEDQNSPVPQFIWKLIMFDQLDDDFYTQAILIVMHNDPYTPDQKTICNDVSENWGWMVSNKDYETGLTYGCPVNESITTQLHDKFNVNYASLNLNDVRMFKHNENDTFPPLFVIKKPNTFYAVADKFQYVEGQDNALQFFIPPRNELYNACPEENAPLYPTYALKVQELVTDFEASSLQQFVKGDFVKYNCRYPIKPIVLKPKQRFGDQSVVMYDIGFLMHEKNDNFDKFFELYENFTEINSSNPIQEFDFLRFLTITTERPSGTVLLVLHEIISGGLLEPESAYSIPSLYIEKNVDVFEFDVDYLYTEENQEKMFSSIFGQSYADYYNPLNRSLQKVQLAPHEDFPLNTWKLTSFMNLNTVAMWEQLYHQWRKVEIFVRKVARELEQLTIETGAARILSLPDAEGKQQPLYLREEKKSPVHRYIWKLVMFHQLNNDVNTQAILIVMHNDPYTPDQKPICDDVGESLGWMVSNKNYETGVTYVCPVVWKVTSKLHDEYNKNYEIFNLRNVYKLEYDENKLLKKFFYDIHSNVMSRS